MCVIVLVISQFILQKIAPVGAESTLGKIQCLFEFLPTVCQKSYMKI